MIPHWQRALIEVAQHHMTQAPLAENPVDALTGDFQRLLSRKHNIPVASGTAAIHCALAGIGIEPGDEVLVPANTCAAVVMAVLAAGGLPVLVDVDETLTIDPDAVSERLTERTRAVIVVHQFGTVADIETLRRHLPPQTTLIEDCAQSIGATVDGQPTGVFGDIAIFSFAHRKIISAGHGGLLALDDDKIARQARRYAQLGADTAPYHLERGLNYEMAPLAAVIIRQQLSELAGNLAARAKIADLYSRFLPPFGLMPVRSRVAGATPAWHRCVMLVPSEINLSSSIDTALDAAGIAYQPQHPSPLHRSPVMEIARSMARRYGSLLDPAAPLPRAEALGERSRYLRVGPEQKLEQAEAAIARMRVASDLRGSEVAQ